MAKTNGNGKRAAAYLRCSTDQQPQSIADQRHEIERAAASRGYSIVKEYVDDGVSGTSIDGRTGFQLLIKDGTRTDRPFDDVFVYDVKRFSRGDADETGYYRHLLKQSGVDIIYVAESFSGNDTDDIVRSVKQYLARQESKDLSKVTIRGQVSAAKKGWWTGGAPPWGFDLAYFDPNGKLINEVRYMENGESQLLDPEGKLTRTLARKERRGKSDGEIVKLVPSAPDRVRLIQRIFHMYLIDRLGYKSIADKLNGEELPSPRNGNYSSKAQKGWAGSTIKGILDNPNYVGDLVWNRRTGAKFHRIAGERAVERGQILSATLQPNDDSDFVVTPNAHPAIIDRETFEAVKRLQASRRLHHQGPPYQTGKAKRSPYLLTGLMHCTCGHVFSGQVVNRGKLKKDGSRIRNYYYLCGGYRDKGRHVCVKAQLSRDAIEGEVLSRIRDRVEGFLDGGGEEVLRTLLGRGLKTKSSESKVQVQNVKQRIKEIDHDIDRLLDSLTPEIKDVISKKITELKKEQEELRIQLDEAAARHGQEIDIDSLADDIIEKIRCFEDVFKEGTIEEKKEFVSLFVEGIDVDPRAKTLRMHIRRFPAPASLDTGNLSFRMVAGVGFEPTTFGLCLPLQLSLP